MTAATATRELQPEAFAHPLRLALGPSWRAVELSALAGGHAGMTLKLQALGPAGRRRAFVLKCAPAGVARGGAADVCRQVPLLRALHGAGLPVPAVAWADEHGHGHVPAHVAFEWVDGRQSFPLAEAERGSDLLPGTLWREAVDVLARLSRFAPTGLGASWAPVALADEVARWEPTLRKSPEPGWIELGLRARDALLAALPEPGPPGVVHGDYQPSNLMIGADGRATLIDWDLAFVGDTLIDIGWLLMWADPAQWRARWRSRCALPPAELASRYFEARGLAPRPLHWYRAFAAYRFGAIACLNVRLHRNGKRPDVVWERFADDVPHLFASVKQWLECGDAA